jgi:hypothetical protein
MKLLDTLQIPAIRNRHRICCGSGSDFLLLLTGYCLLRGGVLIVIDIYLY